MSWNMTDKEASEMGCAMLTAALDAFGAFPGFDYGSEENDQNEIAQRVVRALAAARATEKKETLRIANARGCDWAHHNVEAHAVVATAFWMWSEAVDLDVSEVFPDSAIGARLLGLAQGLMAAHAITEGLSRLDADYSWTDMDLYSEGALYFEERRKMDSE